MYTCYIQSFKILASFCRWAGWFECYLVENSRRHVFAWWPFTWCGSYNALKVNGVWKITWASTSATCIYGPRQANLCLWAFHLTWQILTAHAQPFREASDLAFCLKVPLDSLLVWASSGGSGETAQMRRLAWTFAARIDDKYQIRLTRSIYLLTW